MSVLSWPARFILAAVERWQVFFFAPIPTSNVVWMRRLTAGALILFFGIRAIDFHFYFGDQGLLPLQTMKDAIPEFYRPPFFPVPPNETVALVLQVLLFGFLFLQLFGVGEKLYGGRPVAIVVWLLNLSLSSRNYVILYGADYVSCAWLFYLMWIRSDGRQTLVSSAGFRLLQIQVCFVYAFGGLDKFRGASWWDGTALWRALSNPLYVTHDFISALSYVPTLVAALTFLTALWESYFPVIVWSNRHRGWYLMIGVGMHLGIAFGMNLLFFSALMLCTYLLFLNPLPPCGLWFRTFATRLSKQTSTFSRLERLSRKRCSF